MKIRIGNDICLRVTLSDIHAGLPVNIKGVRAFIVNDTLIKKAKRDLENKTRFISRFPIEPCVGAYSSTAYNINCSGFPMYREYPKNHLCATYAGFGPRPDWDCIYKPWPSKHIAEYQAPVKFMEQVNTIEVFYPASAQLFTGVYNLVIVADIYDSEYGSNNLKTVTIDKQGVFELVSNTEEGADGDIDIIVKQVHHADDVTPLDVHVQSGDYSDSNINLYLNNERTIQIPINDITDWGGDWSN